MLAIRKNRFTWTATTHTVFNTPSYIWSNKTGCCLGQLFKLSQSSADLTLILTTKSVVTNNPHFHCTNAFTAAQIHLKLHMLRRTAHKKPYWIWNVLAGDNFGRSLRGKSRHLGGGIPPRDVHWMFGVWRNSMVHGGSCGGHRSVFCVYASELIVS